LFFLAVQIKVVRRHQVAILQLQNFGVVLFFVVCFASVILSGCSVRRDTSPSNDGIAVIKREYDSVSGILSAISEEERSNDIRPGLLRSVAMVESECNPYAVNVGGRSYAFKSMSKATDFVKSMVKSGRTNLSVGCLQLHYGTHRGSFSSVDDLLNPELNISYAARLLRKLYDKHGSWEKATQRYHTSNPNRGKSYYRKVLKAHNKI
jgi:soluble lytic murein transglycosylase-like protein